jgi:hypothetical protein
MTFAEANSEQPKTLVVVVTGETWLRRSTMEARPALSPACPREPVMPPLKTSEPFAS